MNYQEKYKSACKKAFEGFSLDLKGSRNPEEVVKVYEMAKNGYLSKEIAKSIGKTPKAIQKIYRRYDFPCLKNLCPRKMEDALNWKGGYKMMKGYLYIRTPGHPNGTKHGNYVAAHRLVMEEKLGRYLEKTEVVDHIDGDIKNNSPENLRVFPSNAEHLRVTLKGKIPNWTAEGIKKMHQSRSKPRKNWKGIPRTPKND